MSKDKDDQKGGDDEQLEIHEDIMVLVRRRGGKRQSLTKTIKFIKENSLDLASIKLYIEKLADLKSALNLLDNEIDSYMLKNNKWTDDQYYNALDKQEEYSNDLNKAKLELELRLESVNENMRRMSESTRVKLPEIQLPVFDGRPESYNKFITSFENLINKYNLSPFEKFSYLSKQLRGPAKKLVDSLSQNEMDYDSAVDLLKDAYRDVTCQKYSVIDRLHNLKLSNNASHAFEWISEARTISDQVNNLNIDSDLFLQYFLWKSLNDDFRSLLTSVTPEIKTFIK